MNSPVLTIVVPCYNEEEVLADTISKLDGLLCVLKKEEQVAKDSKILFVDDGSQDQTWSIIYKTSLKNDQVRGLKLSRNVGHQNALLAGLYTAKKASDCVVSIDADLQDDIDVIKHFIEKFREGYEVVYGVRRKRETDTLFKRTTAEGFYKVMSKMGVNLVYNHADFRLMSKRAIEELERFEEVNLFLRGIVPLIGFNATSIYYDRKERLAGETKYPLKKMLAFAFDGITSFSVTPIRFVLFIGFLFFSASILVGLYFITLKISGHTEMGWTSLIISIWLIGGLQLMAIGLVGEYIGKIYKETKRRPKFTIDVDLYSLSWQIKTKNSQRINDDSYDLNLRKLPETN